MTSPTHAGVQLNPVYSQAQKILPSSLAYSTTSLSTCQWMLQIGLAWITPIPAVTYGCCSMEHPVLTLALGSHQCQLVGAIAQSIQQSPHSFLAIAYWQVSRRHHFYSVKIVALRY